MIATAPGAAVFLAIPTELRRVCVVKTPIAPPKKCYNRYIICINSTYLRKNDQAKQMIELSTHLERSPRHIRHIGRDHTIWKSFGNNI